MADPDAAVDRFVALALATPPARFRSADDEDVFIAPVVRVLRRQRGRWACAAVVDAVGEAVDLRGFILRALDDVRGQRVRVEVVHQRSETALHRLDLLPQGPMPPWTVRGPT